MGVMSAISAACVGLGTPLCSIAVRTGGLFAPALISKLDGLGIRIQERVLEGKPVLGPDQKLLFRVEGPDLVQHLVPKHRRLLAVRRQAPLRTAPPLFAPGCVVRSRRSGR